MSQIDQFLEIHWDNYLSEHLDGESVTDGAFRKAYESIMEAVKKTDLQLPDESIIMPHTSTPSTTTPMTPANKLKLTDADIATLKTLKTIDDLKVCRHLPTSYLF